jgi:hypothetical protein
MQPVLRAAENTMKYKMFFLFEIFFLVASSVQVSAQDWQKITCPDGLDNKIEVEYKADTFKYQSNGRDDNVQYFFRVTNRYQTQHRVWVIITTQTGIKRETWNNVPVTLTPNKPFRNSSYITAYGIDLLSCRVSFSRPGATGKPTSEANGKPLNPGVDEVTFPGPQPTPKPKQKSRKAGLGFAALKWSL